MALAKFGAQMIAASVGGLDLRLRSFFPETPAPRRESPVSGRASTAGARDEGMNRAGIVKDSID